MSAKAQVGGSRRSRPCSFDVLVAVGSLALAVMMIAAAWNVVMFERSAASIRSEISETGGKLGEVRQRHAMAEAFAWTDDVFVAGRARSLMIDIGVGVKDPDTMALEPLVSHLIERKPTLGGNWLSLAQLRQVNGASLDEVTSLVKISTILSPHDGHVIVPRVVLAIQNWDAASEAMKRQSVDELLTVTGASGATFQWDIFMDVLRDQSEEVRSDIRRRLQALRPGNSQLLRQLGL